MKTRKSRKTYAFFIQFASLILHSTLIAHINDNHNDNCHPDGKLRLRLGLSLWREGLGGEAFSFFVHLKPLHPSIVQFRLDARRGAIENAPTSDATCIHVLTKFFRLAVH